MLNLNNSAVHRIEIHFLVEGYVHDEGLWFTQIDIVEAVVDE
jgi:hypothetical protein